MVALEEPPAEAGWLTKKKALLGAVVGVVALCLCVAVAGAGIWAFNRGAADKVNWRPGPTRTLSIPSGDNATVNDPETGLTFLFPNGGSGSFAIASIQSGPEAPGPGQGFWLDYKGQTPVQLMVKADNEESVAAFGYGILLGADLPAQERWLTLPFLENKNGLSIYALPLPGATETTTLRRNLLSVGSAAAPFGPGGPWPAQAAPNKRLTFNHYWITNLPPTQNRAKVLRTVEETIKLFLAALPPASRARAEAVIRQPDGPLNLLYGYNRIFTHETGNYYASTGGRDNGSRLSIQETLVDTDMQARIAHELGHYFSHVLMGTPGYTTLETQADLPGYDNHGMGTPWRDRALFLDEPAYFSEWAFQSGQGGGMSPENPRSLLGKLDPLTTDLPSVEGFGALLLASLNRERAMVTNWTKGNVQEAPVINAPIGEIWAILEGGPTNIDQLYDQVEQYLVSTGHPDALPVIAQRIGWSYAIKGKVVDQNHNAVPGASVENVKIVDGKSYSGGSTHGVSTGADGRFMVGDSVFPGVSQLVVTTKDGQKHQAKNPISLDHRRHTNEPAFDVGEVMIDVTPSPTPTTTATSSPASTPTTKTPIDWVLQSIIPQPNPGKDDACYFNKKLTIADGSFSSSYSWVDKGCVEGGSASGSVETKGSWTAPPSYLKAGITLTLDLSMSSTASQTGGGRNSGGWGMRYMTKNPPKDNPASNAGRISIGGDVKASGWTGDFPVSGFESASVKIPDGKNGDTLAIVIFATGPGGSGNFVYLYAYGATNQPPDRPTPAPVIAATPLPATATPSPTPTETPKPASATPTTKPASTPTTRSAPATPTATAMGEQQFFIVASLGAAYNGATKPTIFTISRSWLVTKVVTYHWNNGQGVTPGTIGLRASDGTTYGPWTAVGEPGSGGVVNAYWAVKPSTVIPPGTYTVVDSDPTTWSQNQETDGAGMAWGFGIPR